MGLLVGIHRPLIQSGEGEPQSAAPLRHFGGRVSIRRLMVVVLDSGHGASGCFVRGLKGCAPHQPRIMEPRSGET
jgi:hypothetical protein